MRCLSLPSCGSSTPNQLSGSKLFGCNSFRDRCQQKWCDLSRISGNQTNLGPQNTHRRVFASSHWMTFVFCTLSKAPRDSSDESSGITAYVCSGTDMQQNTRQIHSVPKTYDPRRLPNFIHMLSLKKGKISSVRTSNGIPTQASQRKLSSH